MRLPLLPLFALLLLSACGKGVGDIPDHPTFAECKMLIDDQSPYADCKDSARECNERSTFRSAYCFMRVDPNDCAALPTVERQRCIARLLDIASYASDLDVDSPYGQRSDVCLKINDQRLIDECYVYVTQREKDGTLCVKIRDEALRLECLDGLVDAQLQPVR